MNLEPIKSETVKVATSIPENLNLSSSNVDEVGKKVFDAVQISRPEIKWWKLSTSNLTRQEGFFKYFKYVWQILKRFADDKYLGLRNAVDAFNTHNSEENLNKLIKHISLLRGHLFDYDEQDSLVRIANEAILYKVKFWKSANFEYDPQRAEIVRNIKTTSLDLEKLNAAINNHNINRSHESTKVIIDELLNWIKNSPSEYAEKYPQVQQMLRALSCGMKDEELFFQLNLLQSEATENTLRKILKLQFVNKAGEHPLELPQIKSYFSWSTRLRALQEAISKYNAEKSENHYKKVIESLMRWQFANSHCLNQGNTQLLIKQLIRISEGVSKQQEIRENEAYQLLDVLENLSDEAVRTQNWGNLPIPICYNEKLRNSIAEFNQNKSFEKLKNVIAHIKNWVQDIPDDFKYGGINLLRQIQMQAIKSVYIDKLEFKKTLSQELVNLNQEIRCYNTSKNLERLSQIQIGVEIWKSKQPAEYEFYYGALIKEKIDKISKLGIYEPILLPSSHPNVVVENSLEFNSENATNAYIVNFHNPVMPWSHTETVMAKKKSVKLTPKCFNLTDGSPSNEYFSDGKLVKEIDLKDFPISQQEYIFDVINYIIIPSKYDDSQYLDPDKFRNIIDTRKSEEAFKILQIFDAIDENGYLRNEILADNAFLWDELTRKFDTRSHSPWWNISKEDNSLHTTNYLVFLRAVLASPIPRKFNKNSFIRSNIEPTEIEEIYKFCKEHQIVSSDDQMMLLQNWEKGLTEDNLEKLKENREFVLYTLYKAAAQMKIQREYLGIGADTANLDSDAANVEGVHIVDDKVASRMERLCRRRKNEMQKVMNIFGGAKSGLLSFFGEIQKQLFSRQDRIRHFRQALIDNLMTNMNPNAFTPDFKEPRYRLELYESGGQLYEKWIEDENGKFSRVKAPSSQKTSGEFIDGEYSRNNYVLDNGRLVSTKKKFLKDNVNYEWGNIIFKEDGKEEWQADEERGQLVKSKTDDSIPKIDVPFYSAQTCEKYLNNGETEWCGSYSVRMLQGAYAFEHMPEFQETVKGLAVNLQSATNTDFNKTGTKFEMKHAKMLFTLAEEYAKKLVKSEAGKRYFRDMNGRIKFSPRGTPDMLQKSLEGRTPGIINSFKRAWRVLQFNEVNAADANWKNKLLLGAGKVLVGILGLPFAVLKLAYNVAAATISLFFDIGLAFKNGYKESKAEQARASEAGIKIEYPRWDLLKGTVSYGIYNGIISRLFGDFLGLKDLIPKQKPISPAFE